VELNGAARLLIAHNPVGKDDDPSTADVLAQVELVETAAARLGLDALRVPVAAWRAWEDLRARLRRGDCVFNLVEAPPGLPAVHPATASAFERLGIPFTGAGTDCLWLTTDKLATRAVLAASGLPVAPGGGLDAGATVLDRVAPPWILKPSCEEASIGLDGDAVCATRDAALARAAALAARFPRQRLLVERYLPGREINVSLLAGRARRAAGNRQDVQDVQALPVAEIDFVDYPPGMPRIVGYEAKWEPQSFAYTHTVRRFPTDRASAPLVAAARRLALAAWRACGLAGYGRIDLRVDDQGGLCILEVNANPCLAADAGFMAAAAQAGLDAAAVVARIVAAALARVSGRQGVPEPRRGFSRPSQPVTRRATSVAGTSEPVAVAGLTSLPMAR
jgi:D-alanine-D-alanine ligase